MPTDKQTNLPAYTQKKRQKKARKDGADKRKREMPIDIKTT